MTEKRPAKRKRKDVLKSAVRAIKELLATPEDLVAAPRSHEGAELPLTARAEDAPDCEQFPDDALSLSIKNRSSIVAGSLEFVGLDDVRLFMSDSWPQVAELVRDVAEEELRACLDPLDIFRPHGEAAYLIHFDSLDKAAAEDKAAAITKRLREALVERIPEVAAAISVEHFVAEVDATTLQQRGNLSLVERIFARLTEMRRDVEATFRRDRRSIVRELQVQFSPIWHVQKQVTILNRSIVQRPSDITPYTLDMDDQQELAAIRAQIDFVALAKSIEALHRIMQSSRSAMVMTPVDLATLSDKSTAATYMRLLTAVPASYRKKLALEVYSHEDPPVLSLLHAAYSLKLHTPYVSIDLDLKTTQLEALLAGGPWAVSVDLEGLNVTGGQATPDLRRFTMTANQAGVITMARGANSVGLVVAAVAAQFTYVDGRAVHLPLREPRPPLRLRSPVPQTAAPGKMRTVSRKQRAVR